MEKKIEHMPCNKELKSKIKELVEFAKKNNLIKPHTEAFIKYPVKEEAHKGMLNYYAK